jgi:hypothetical protein
MSKAVHNFLQGSQEATTQLQQQHATLRQRERTSCCITARLGQHPRMQSHNLNKHLVPEPYGGLYTTPQTAANASACP